MMIPGTRRRRGLRTRQWMARVSRSRTPIGGEKKGRPRFYERMIRLSERLWNEYLSSH